MKDNNFMYDKYLPYWEQIRTFVTGLNDVKDYIQDVTSDTSVAGTKRNKDYKDRAIYVNFPDRTRTALVGSVFRKPAQFKLPTKLEYLLYDTNEAGFSLEHLAKSSVSNIVEVGRHGLLVSYGVNQAKITQYSAETIKEWYLDETGRLKKVELIIGKDEEKHLVLRDGVYTVEIYKEEMLQTSVQPTDFNGKTFDFIPFIIVGSNDNSPDVDEMPLWKIVDLTRGHLQNSADYEDAIKWASVPTPYITGMTESFMNTFYQNGEITFGAGSVITLPDGGSAGVIEVSEKQVASAAMEQKEAQLIKIGARIMTGDSKQQTATATEIQYSSDNSILDNIVGNVSEALETCIEWCGLFMGVQDTEIMYQLNREFYAKNVDPQLIMAQVNLLDRRLMSDIDLLENLKKYGLIDTDKTIEDIRAELEQYAGGM